jgi:hypothetical protein
MQKEIQTIRETVELLYPKEIQRNILKDDGSIETWKETFSAPQEFIESEKKFLKRMHDVQHKKFHGDKHEQ